VAGAFPIRRFGFTLVEIMIVVAIMGIVLTMGVPMVYKVWHRAPMAKAVRDIVEVCSHARAQAIMQGHEVDVVFHPREGRMEVGSPIGITNAPPPTPGAAPPPVPSVMAPAPSGAGLSAHFQKESSSS
jgi:prepilin-type N-terminal cleavage/methylation domain-containing protein